MVGCRSIRWTCDALGTRLADSHTRPFFLGFSSAPPPFAGYGLQAGNQEEKEAELTRNARLTRKMRIRRVSKIYASEQGRRDLFAVQRAGAQTSTDTSVCAPARAGTQLRSGRTDRKCLCYGTSGAAAASAADRSASSGAASWRPHPPRAHRQKCVCSSVLQA
jgi:hypothetical protein